MYCQTVIALDLDRTSQAVDRQPLYQVAGSLRFAIKQQIISVRPNQKVEQAFSLGGQQTGPDGQRPRDILGHQPLQIFARVLAGQANDGPIYKGGTRWAIRGHDA